jgi:hypothetical protein
MKEGRKGMQQIRSSHDLIISTTGGSRKPTYLKMLLLATRPMEEKVPRKKMPMRLGSG